MECGKWGDIVAFYPARESRRLPPVPRLRTGRPVNRCL